jgi:hypothetical protein
MRWGRGGDRPNNDFFYYFGPRRRWRNVVAVPWRYRYELLVAAVLLLCAHAVAQLANPAWLILPLGLAVTSACIPQVRQALMDRFWCVLLPHRMRVGMVESGVLSWSGYLPGVLWTAARPHGVEIWVWCPAGVDVRAFEATRSQLAASCWAVDVEPRRHPRWSHIVRLLVIIRPEYAPPRSRLL